MNASPIQLGLIPLEVDADSSWWWTALKEGNLFLPRCRDCRRFFFPPQSTCPHCGSGEWERVRSNGVGSVYSWVVIHVALDARFEKDVPYTIVAVELDEGVRLFGRLPSSALPRAGLRVQLIVYEVKGTSLPGFVIHPLA